MKAKELTFIEEFHHIVTVKQTIDFDDLDTSCNSNNNAYAKRILQELHNVFMKTHKTNPLEKDIKFLWIPAVIMDKNKHLYIGTVCIDTKYHDKCWGTKIITSTGLISDFHELNYFKEHIYPYKYYTTPNIRNTNHDDIPDNIKDLMPTEFLTK